MPGEGGVVRVGWLPVAGAVLLPRALTVLRRTHPALRVVTREGGTPALVRALRAGSLDLALLASMPPFRPPDAESPPLVLQILAERSLRLAVPASHPLARGDFVDVADLRGQRWIAGSATRDDWTMGVWPGLDERPEIVHIARDWLAKLHLVAVGCGLTTVSAALAEAAPPAYASCRSAAAPRNCDACCWPGSRTRPPKRSPTSPPPCAPPPSKPAPRRSRRSGEDVHAQYVHRIASRTPGQAPPIMIGWRDSVPSMAQDDGIEETAQTAGTRNDDLGCSPRVTLRRISAHDQGEFLERVHASVDLHRPTMSLPATPEAFQAFLSRFDEGRSVEGLLVCLRDSGAIVGNININIIITGLLDRTATGQDSPCPSPPREGRRATTV